MSRTPPKPHRLPALFNSPNKCGHPLLEMQRAVGNREVMRWLRSEAASVEDACVEERLRRRKLLAGITVAVLIAAAVALALWLTLGRLR